MEILDGPPYRHHGHDRQPRQATRARLPVERDLRRSARVLGLRSARRRAQEQRQARVVEVHGPGPRRRRRPRLLGDPRPRGVGGQRPRQGVRRPADRVPVLPQALPRRPPRGGLRREARRKGPRERPGRPDLPELRHQGRLHRAPHVQRPAQDLPRRRRGRVRPGLPPARDRAGHLHQLPQRPAVVPQEDPVRHRPDRQVVPQRDHPGQLHLPHPRVRADGDGVLRQARQRRGVAPVLDRRALPVVRRPRHQPRQPPAVRAPEGQAVALLQAHRRCGVPLQLHRLRVG